MGTLDWSFGTGGVAKSISPGDKVAVLYPCGLTGVLDEVNLFLYKYTTATQDLVLELWSANANNSINAKIADLGTYAKELFSASYAWRTLSITSGPSVTSGTNYYVVYYPAAGGSGTQYATYINAILSAGVSRQFFYYGGVWSVIGRGNYKLYVNGDIVEQQTVLDAPQALNDTNREAFEWTPSASGSVTRFDLIGYLYSGSYAALNAEIRADSGGVPGAVITNGNLGRVPYTSMDASYSWRTLTPGTAPSVTAGTKYWIVFWKDNTDGAGNVAVYVNYDFNRQTYLSTDDGSTWKSRTLYLKTYVVEGGSVAIPALTLQPPVIGSGIYV